MIQEYLDEKAKSDELFEKMYKKPGKDIDSCWAYIVNMAKRKGGACVCMSDDEVFGLAVHYYCEDKLDVKDAALWIDMLEALSYMGKDTHNAFFVCPKNLKEEHDKWVNLRRKKQQKIEMERKRKQALFWEEQYKKEKGRFFDLSISNGRVTIKTIQSVREMQEEGDFMHHCVATNEYYKKKDSLIMSAVDECGNRLETIEINLKTMKVVQCFGMYNKTTDRHQEILEVINGNIKEVIKANSCKL